LIVGLEDALEIGVEVEADLGAPQAVRGGELEVSLLVRPLDLADQFAETGVQAFVFEREVQRAGHFLGRAYALNLSYLRIGKQHFFEKLGI